MIELLSGPEFRSGLIAGALALTCVLLIQPIRNHSRRKLVIPTAGVAIAIAASAALTHSEIGMDTGAQQTLVLALFGGGAAAYFRFGFLKTLIAYLPAAIQLGTIDNFEGAPRWTPIAVAMLLCLGGALCADFEIHSPTLGVGPTAFVLTLFGVASTLPDTEHIAILLGASLPIAVIGHTAANEGVGNVAWAGLIGLTGWTIWFDGRGRPGAIVGAIGAFGVLVIEPVVRYARLLTARENASTRRVSSRSTAVAFMCVQALIALAAGRIAGLREDASSAALIVLGLWIVTAIACLAVPYLSGISGRNAATRSGGRVDSGHRRP